MATATAQVGLEEISEINRQLEENTATRATLESNLREAVAAIGELDGEKRKLLMRIAAGDHSGHAKVDQVDRTKLELERQADGLRLKIGELDPAIVELQKKQSALLAQAADLKRQEMADTLRAEVLLHARNQIACWRRGCRESFLVSETLARAQASGITERQYAQIRAQVTELFDRENGARVNEKWKNRSSSAGGPLMTIMPECPPDSQRDREELR